MKRIAYWVFCWGSIGDYATLSLGRQHIFGRIREDLSQKADYVGNRDLLINVAK